MLQTLSKKIRTCLVVLLILVTCTSCKAGSSYKIADYIDDLAIISGIGNDGLSTNENFIRLMNWGIVSEDEINKLDDYLDYYYLSKTIARLIDEDYENLATIKNLGWIDVNANANNLVSEKEAQSVIYYAVNYINNLQVESVYDYDFKDNVKSVDDQLEIGDVVYDENKGSYLIVKDIDENGIIYHEADFEDVFLHMDISDSFELNLDEAQVIPYGQEGELVNYVNTSYNLLASKKNHVFNTDGFRISYTLNSSGITVHVSKDVDGINMYADLSLSNIKPTFKYTYDEGDFSNCYFKVAYRATEKLGASVGKYSNYQVNFEDLDSSSFLNKLKSTVKKQNDEIEATLKICEIKTPIPNVPTAFLNIDVLLKFYISGKVEMVCYSTNNIGFEMRNGQLRSIYDVNRDVDAIASASAKACAGLNFNLEAVKFRLMDVELDGGVKTEVKTTLHLYDKDGNETKQDVDLAYSSVDELSKNNEDVKVCGDVSLYWIFDIYLNTAKTKMYKMGFSREFNILDEDNQIFNNMHHIENGMFVKACTRKSKNKIKTEFEKASSNKIVLNSYSEVLSINETYNIAIVSLPDSYTSSDLMFDSENAGIAYVTGKTITALSPGVTKVRVYTSDNKYEAYINILVSKS